MNICFVEVPSPWIVRPHAQVPLGPLYLGTILQKYHHVRLVRLNRKEDLLKLRGFDVIAFSGTTLEYPQVEECSLFCRENLRGTSLWYGGPHATCIANELPSGLFDSIAIGESESFILDMANDCQNGTLRQIYGPVGLIEDLDSIPLPNRELIEGSHGGAIFSFGKSFNGSGHENVITSRGCMWNCHFCSSRIMWGNKTRFRSIDNILSELETIVSNGCYQVRFSDDNLTTDKHRLMSFCKEIKRLKIAWRCSARANTLLEKDVCDAMANAGCKEVSIGIESGDERVLNFLNKRSDLKDMEQGCRQSTDSGINVRGLFMIGTPGEFADTPEINRDFIAKTPLHSITLSTYVPLPGSAVWICPEKFDCEILTKDFSQYNKDLWVRNKKEKILREPQLLIWNHNLSQQQQMDNIHRMQKYALECGKLNLG